MVGSGRGREEEAARSGQAEFGAAVVVAQAGDDEAQRLVEVSMVGTAALLGQRARASGGEVVTVAAAGEVVGGGSGELHRGTSTYAVSLVGGSPRSACTFAQRAKASQMLARASSLLCPWLTQPGRAGHSAI